MERAHANSPGSHQYGGFTFPELSESDPAEEKDNGWLISFVDILTLLITLFVLLLAFNRAVPHESPHRDKAAPQTQPALAARSAEPQPAPPFSVPQDIRDKVDIVASTTAVNLVIKDDVLFAEGSTTLTPLGHTVLDGIARMLAQNDYPVSVEGHTDNVPIQTAQFPSNWELSSFRATNVARYFIQRGIAERRLSAVGYADTRPIADNSSAAGRARNRRVSLVIHVNDAADKAQGNTEKPTAAPN
jgi:chemotaxis protein MotB